MWALLPVDVIQQWWDCWQHTYCRIWASDTDFEGNNSQAHLTSRFHKSAMGVLSWIIKYEMLGVCIVWIGLLHLCNKTNQKYPWGSCTLIPSHPDGVHKPLSRQGNANAHSKDCKQKQWPLAQSPVLTETYMAGEANVKARLLSSPMSEVLEVTVTAVTFRLC